MSLAVDLPDSDWLMIGLAGSWSRERHVVERPLAPGRQSASSTRGASGHQNNPYIALRRQATDEAYGFSLVYSGNFLAEAEVEPYGTTPVRLGIEPDTFRWRLEPGAGFTTPEAIVAYSDAFYRRHRELFQRGRFVRLVSPFEGDRQRVAWMVVANDRRRAVVGTYRILGHPDPGARTAAPAWTRSGRTLLGVDLAGG